MSTSIATIAAIAAAHLNKHWHLDGNFNVMHKLAVEIKGYHGRPFGVMVELVVVMHVRQAAYQVLLAARQRHSQPTDRPWTRPRGVGKPSTAATQDKPV